MSIYATWLSLDGDSGHAEDCAALIEEEPGVLVLSGKRCNCPERFRQPIVYRGSNAVPSEHDPRGGTIFFCAIPDHCHPDVREASAEALQKMRAEGWDEVEPLGDTGLAAVRMTERTGDILGAIQREHSKPVEFARLSVTGADEPGMEPQSVTLILTREHITELRDTFTAWLDAKERA